MKISEITREMILNQLREDEAALSSEELAYIDVLKDAAISYIKEWTGISGVDTPDDNGHKLDDYDDLVYPFMAAISHMYDNRQMTIDKDNMNPVSIQILNMHSFIQVA